jgi:hypothetical protein
VRAPGADGEAADGSGQYESQVRGPILCFLFGRALIGTLYTINGRGHSFAFQVTDNSSTAHDGETEERAYSSASE